MKEFSQELWHDLKTAIDQEVALSPHPVAAFDADGTLWDTDIGESFFQFQIKNKLLSHLPQNPWQHYIDKKNTNDPRPAYLWLAQINHGVPIETVRQWSQRALQEQSPLPIFLSQKKLIDYLLHRGVEVYVVSASVKWAIEPAAQLFGINQDHVIGVHTKIDSGLVSNQSAGPVTYKEGKVEALKLATQGKAPFLCAGNTMGDVSLLKWATGVSLAVSGAAHNSELWKKEQELIQFAKKNGWKTHEF